AAHAADALAGQRMRMLFLGRGCGLLRWPFTRPSTVRPVDIHSNSQARASPTHHPSTDPVPGASSSSAWSVALGQLPDCHQRGVSFKIGSARQGGLSKLYENPIRGTGWTYTRQAAACHESDNRQ